MFWKLSCSFFLTIVLGTFQVADVEGGSEAGGGPPPPLGHGYHRVARRSVRKAASIGGSKILECDINYPGGQWVEHIIQWRKQGIEVPIFIQFNGYPPHVDAGYQGRIRLVEQASIEISDIRTTDEGWFECSIVFLDGNDDSNTNGTWIYLSVNSPPVLGEVSPSFLIQKEGDTVDMYCDATATPEPALTWYKDGKVLEASSRVKINNNRIQVCNLEREDGGVYTCTFKNVVGQVSHIIKLVIEGNAYIMVPPKNTTANEGTRVKLSCQAEGYPNNITYRWFKNGVDIQQVPGLMTRAGVYADGSFVISTVIKEDTGWYKCRPSNGLGPPPEAQAYLNVTYLPRVLSMPVRIYLPKGMAGRILCPVEANPPVTLIVWTRNERVIDFTHSPRLKLSKDGTLLIKAVTATDEGRYTCTPYSPLGAGRSSTVVQIIVRDPPYFMIRPKQYYQRQPTQSVTMPCVAEGDPKPDISWRKADGTFPAKNRIIQDGGNLTIVNLGKEDHGSYECVATNVVTSVITTTLLIIELTTPHAPYNVTVDTTQFTAKVSWLPGYDGNYPQHYVLWYRLKKQTKNWYRSQGGTREEWHTLRVVPDEATSLTVYNLLSDRTYQFSVLSRNRLGDGLFSKIVTAKTKGYDSSQGTLYPPGTGSSPQPPLGPRPNPPRNVTVRQQRNGLLISWLPPLNTSSTSPVGHYVVHYRTVGRWVPLTSKIEGKTWYLWTTASRGAMYRFQVYSYSPNDVASEPSVMITFNTGDPMLDGVQISDGMIGGIVGGLLFLFVAICLTVMGIKSLIKRRQREKAMRYGNVKYFGPKQVEANKNVLSSERDLRDDLRNSRGSSVEAVGGSAEGLARGHIFTLMTQSRPDQTHSPSTKFTIKDLLSRCGGLLKPAAGSTDSMHSDQLQSNSHELKIRRSNAGNSPRIGLISRTHDGRFILCEENNNLSEARNEGVVIAREVDDAIEHGSSPGMNARPATPGGLSPEGLHLQLGLSHRIMAQHYGLRGFDKACCPPPLWPGDGQQASVHVAQSDPPAYLPAARASCRDRLSKGLSREIPTSTKEGSISSLQATKTKSGYATSSPAQSSDPPKPLHVSDISSVLASSRSANCMAAPNSDSSLALEMSAIPRSSLMTSVKGDQDELDEAWSPVIGHYDLYPPRVAVNNVQVHHARNALISQDEKSPAHLAYTRDHLEHAVQLLRKSKSCTSSQQLSSYLAGHQRSRSAPEEDIRRQLTQDANLKGRAFEKSLPNSTYNEEQDGISVVVKLDYSIDNCLDQCDATVSPGSSGLGSIGCGQTGETPGTRPSPIGDNVSRSSGLGSTSRDTSQSTTAADGTDTPDMLGNYKKSPYIKHSSQQERPTEHKSLGEGQTVDFDALERELLEALRHCDSPLDNGALGANLATTMHPQGSRHTPSPRRYRRAVEDKIVGDQHPHSRDEQFEYLRREYLAFQRRRQLGSLDYLDLPYWVDSEML